uniref:FHA domain-containing protein n=1 Tax=Glossina palpalis gambiensis TaxID=67801 RepID=A0A1B0BMR2_9MUSC
MSRNYIRFPDKSLDTKHCLLEIRSYEDIFIVDLKSATEVHVNGRQLNPLTKERVKFNEEFCVCGQLKVQISDDEERGCCYVPQVKSEDSDCDMTEFIVINELKVNQFKVSTQEFHDESKMDGSSTLIKDKSIAKEDAKTQRPEVSNVDTFMKPLTEDIFLAEVEKNGFGKQDEKNGLVKLMNEGFEQFLPHIRDSSPREEEPTRRLTCARPRECEEPTRRLTRTRARECEILD